MLAHFLEHLDITNRIVFVENKYGAMIKRKFFDKNAIGFTKGIVFVIGKCDYSVNTCCSTPACLSKGKVSADCQNDNIFSK
ncbi:hypothetical protein D3C81_1783750 [compost metagenome]